MIRNWLIKILLSPISMVYGLIIAMRNGSYDSGLVKSTSFDLPIVSVGNLAIGGAGKTPHIEYLIQLLRPYLNLATLSRGYKRKSKGFLFIQPNSSVEQAGDEPLVMKQKYRDVVVAVSESRVIGVTKIVQQFPNTQAILLDDAFQHRSINPGLSILLTTYDEPYSKDYLLPSGRLRESRSAAKRADIVIVTKCPESLSEIEANKLYQSLNLEVSQRIFYSYYKYGVPYYIFNPNYRLTLDSTYSIILLSAIANVDYLRSYLDNVVGEVEGIKFEDHHQFTPHDVSQIKLSFDRLQSDRKFILTTEKDAVRLGPHRQFILDNKLPIYILPLQVSFLFDKKEAFDQSVKNFLLNFRI